MSAAAGRSPSRGIPQTGYSVAYPAPIYKGSVKNFPSVDKRRRGRYHKAGKVGWDMIKNVVFDMGQVLILYDPPYFIRRLGVSEANGALLMNEVFRSLEWTRMDWGTIDSDQAVAGICARLPERLHAAARALVMDWEKPITPIPGIYELTRDLKAAGYGVYLLSNASTRQPEYWPLIPCQKFFDGALLSCDVGYVKPEKGIYEAFTARFGLDPETCFFVDDTPANVEGAIRCGWSGAVFHGDAAALRRQLRQAGVDVKA